MNQSEENNSWMIIIYKVSYYLFVAAILVALESLLLMLAWNVGVCTIWTNVPQISYWKMYLIVIGLSVIADVIKGINFAGSIE